MPSSPPPVLLVGCRHAAGARAASTDAQESQAQRRDACGACEALRGLPPASRPGPASIAQTTPGFCLSTHTRPRFPLSLQPLLTTSPPTELCPRPRPRSGSCRPHLPGLDSPAGAWTGLQLPEQPQEPHNIRGGTTARGRCLETRGLRSPTPQTSRTTDTDGGDGLSSPTQTRPPRCAKR